MNKKQKIILTIFIPIIVFFIAFTIAYYTGVTTLTTIEKTTSFLGRELSKPWFHTTKTYTYNPFDWGKTWYVWFLFLVFCFIFAYKLFADKNIPDNKKRKDKVNG